MRVSCGFAAATLRPMNWKVLLAVGAVAGGVVLAARHRSRRDAAEGAQWAEATDPVARFGDS